MKVNFCRLVMVVVVAISACAMRDDLRQLIPPDATEVDNRSLSPASRQLTYVVETPYPNFAVPDSGLDYLRGSGWIRCSASQDGWESFVDASRKDARASTVFQNLSYWRKDKQLISIFMRYRAGVLADGSALTTPDTTSQYVILIEDENLDGARWMELKCG